MKPGCILFNLFWFLFPAWCVQGHEEYSKDTLAILNAPAPTWLTVGSPMKSQLAGPAEVKPTTFRAPSGESKCTRTTVTIPGKGIIIHPGYMVSWYHGSSLSPDGTRLIINSGTDCHILQINSDKTHRELETQVPFVTYDDGPKGFISGWFWANDEVMLATAEVSTAGGEVQDCRLYALHLKERVLRRLDLSALGLARADVLEVKSVGSDSQHLVVVVGGRECVLKVDLRPASILAAQKIRAAPNAPAPAGPKTPGKGSG